MSKLTFPMVRRVWSRNPAMNRRKRHTSAKFVARPMEARMARMQELVRVVREVRNRYQIDARTLLDVSVRCPEAAADDFRALAPVASGCGGVTRSPGSRTEAARAVPSDYVSVKKVSVAPGKVGLRR